MQTAFTWQTRLRTKDGRSARLLPRDGWQDCVGDTKRRVAVCHPGYAHWFGESREVSTVYLYDENGTCRCADGTGAEYDLEAA